MFSNKYCYCFDIFKWFQLLQTYNFPILFYINHLFSDSKVVTSGYTLQVLLFNTNSIQRYSFICTKLNDSKDCYEISIIQFCTLLKNFKYCYLTLIILFKITPFVHNYTVPSIVMYHNISIRHESFVYTQLNGQIVLFLTIQFNISHLLAQCFHVKQFYSTHR